AGPSGATLVDVVPFQIHGAAPTRLHAGPRDRQRVALEPEPGHEVDALPPAVVVLAGRLAGVAVRDVAGARREAVPDRFAAAVCPRGALDLKCGGAGSPHELRCAHPFTPPPLIPPPILPPPRPPTTDHR